MSKRYYFACLIMGLLTQSPVSAQWVNRPVNTTVQLHGVEFVTPSVGVAIGANGTILRSTNGGDTWAAVSSGTTQVLKDVTLSSDGSLYAVGDAGVILKSSDQGASWVLQSSGTTLGLNGVHFPVATTGYCAGAGGTILRTTNGGQSWQSVSSGVTNTLGGVFFPTPSVGYVVQLVSNRFLKTVDGGATWATGLLPASLNASLSGKLLFFNANAGMLMGGYSLGIGQDFAAVFTTTDGGATWNRRPVEGVMGWAVNFVSPTTGYALSHGGNLSYPGMEVISQTTDAGATWTTNSFFPPRQAFSQLNDLAFASPTTGILVGQQGQVYRNASVALPTKRQLMGSTQLFPNPATQGIKVIFTTAQRVSSYSLTNPLGQTIQRMPAEPVAEYKPEWLFDLTGLAKGRYFLRINTTEGQIQKHFEIE